MNSLTADVPVPAVAGVRVTDDQLFVELADGRTISAPLAWYPRLSHAAADERNHWRTTGSGQGIHWPDLDEDISVENLLLGKPSGESQASLQKWLQQRRANNSGGEAADG
jgi:hypothetical protein